MSVRRKARPSPLYRAVTLIVHAKLFFDFPPPSLNPQATSLLPVGVAEEMSSLDEETRVDEIKALIYWQEQLKRYHS